MHRDHLVVDHHFAGPDARSGRRRDGEPYRWPANAASVVLSRAIAGEARTALGQSEGCYSGRTAGRRQGRCHYHPGRAVAGRPRAAVSGDGGPHLRAGTIYPTFDTFVHTGYLNTDLSGLSELRVGTPDGGASKARAFLNFPTSSALGKDIISASMSLHETYSYSCNARPINVHASNLASTSSRWNSQPYINSTVYGSLSVAKGYTGCAAGRINVHRLAAALGDRRLQRGGMALQASETDLYGWKKFASLETSTDPVLVGSTVVLYDRSPGPPGPVDAMRAHRVQAADAVRHLGSLHPDLSEGRTAARGVVRPDRPAGRRLDGRTTDSRGIPVGVDRGGVRGGDRQRVRRHRSVHGVHRRGAGRTSVAGRALLPNARGRRPSVR